MESKQDDDEKRLVVSVGGSNEDIQEFFDSFKFMKNKIKIDIIDAEEIEYGSPESKPSGEAMFDIMNDDHVKALLEGVPKAQRREMQQAIKLVRSSVETAGRVVDQGNAILSSVKSLQTRFAAIDKKVAEALKKADENNKKFGFQ